MAQIATGIALTAAAWIRGTGTPQKRVGNALWCDDAECSGNDRCGLPRRNLCIDDQSRAGAVSRADGRPRCTAGDCIVDYGAVGRMQRAFIIRTRRERIRFNRKVIEKTNWNWKDITTNARLWLSESRYKRYNDSCSDKKRQGGALVEEDIA